MCKSHTPVTAEALISSSIPPWKSSNISAYEHLSSGSTTSVAHYILSSPTFKPLTAESYVLDNCSGPGIVTAAIRTLYPSLSSKILAADNSEAMIKELEKRVKVEGWVGAEGRVLDMKNLGEEVGESFSHVICNFGVQQRGDKDGEEGPKMALREIWRVLEPGGQCVVTTWADMGFDVALNATARIVRPAEEPQGWPVTLPADWTRGSWLMRQLEDAGFENKVKVEGMVAYAEDTLEVLVGNLMVFTPGTWFRGYDEAELERAREVLMGEMRKLKGFQEGEGGIARYGMVAWVGWAWK